MPRGRNPIGIPSGYRPALDGVRAIAVLLVMAFHLSISGGLKIVNGGWLGVDVFFVLSGYLITSLLLAEWRRQRRIDLKKFYIRRFLRLAPLSIGLVIILLAFRSLGLSPSINLFLPISGAVSILAYYSNWWAIAHPYGLGSLGHAWTLSVEEQFYFLWPWIVVGVVTIAPRSARRILIALTALAVVAIALIRRSLWLGATSPGASGTDILNEWLSFYRNSLVRGDGLLYGCLLALVLHGITVTPRVKRWITAFAVPATVVAALIVGASHFKRRQPWVPFIPQWGLSLFNLSITIGIAWLVIAPLSPMARMLSVRPLTWIGRRAYGIYLISPLMVHSLKVRTSDRWALEGAVVISSLALAGISFRWLESPFLRLKERFSARTPEWQSPSPSCDSRL